MIITMSNEIEKQTRAVSFADESLNCSQVSLVVFLKRSTGRSIGPLAQTLIEMRVFFSFLC